MSSMSAASYRKLISIAYFKYLDKYIYLNLDILSKVLDYLRRVRVRLVDLALGGGAARAQALHGGGRPHLRLPDLPV